MQYIKHDTKVNLNGLYNIKQKVAKPAQTFLVVASVFL